MRIQSDIRVIPLDIYRSNLIFVCNKKDEYDIREFIEGSSPKSYQKEDIDQIMKWMARSDEKKEAGVHFMHAGDCFVRIFGPVLDAYDIGTLSHEVTHCVNRLLLDRGFELNDGSDEAFCYLHGHLMTEIFKKQ